MYIHFFGNGCWRFRSYSGSLLRSAKVSKTLLPHHLVPRLGSACLNEGLAPWAAAKGHPWPSAATSASMPRCPLRKAFVQPSWLTGRPRSKTEPRRPDSRPGSGWDRVSPVGASLLAKAVCQFAVMLDVPASSRASSLPQEKHVHPKPGRLLGRLAVDVDLGAPLTTLAERRHCGVGIPAWMPG